jgi:hypothetical protein
LRYDVQGPHGGVLTAFATNGRELALLDVANSRYIHGPATAANIDRLLDFLPLNLGPDALVGLFFGDVPVPDDASLEYDDKIGRFVFTWTREGERRSLEIEPQTSRPRRAAVARGEQVVSEVQVDDYDGQGLPVSLHVRVPGQKVDVEIKLRDVEAASELDPTVFELSPPSGVRTEYLSPPAGLP